MASRPVRPPVGLFDNPVRVFSLDELAETVRALERARPGLTGEELARSVFDITGSRWQASTQEVRDWAVSASFEVDADGGIPEQAIAAYNETHPDRPY